MKRLTGKNARLYIPLLTSPKDQKSVNYYEYVDMYNKLAELEDVEEELGIDLITLFKALKDGFYKFNKKGNISYINPMKSIDFKKKWFITSSYKVCFFEDYGKTWALTKEELL